MTANIQGDCRYKKHTEMKYGIMGFIDNGKARAGSALFDLPVFSIAQVKKTQFDKIVMLNNEISLLVYNMPA